MWQNHSTVKNNIICVNINCLNSILNELKYYMFKNLLYGVQLWGMMNTEHTCGELWSIDGVRCLGLR